MSGEQRSSQEKVLLAWQGPDRPFRKRGTQFYFNVSAITVVIFLILFFFVQYSLIAVLFALVFVGIAINTVPPQLIHYKITTKGIYRNNDFASWHELKDFYVDRVHRHDVILLAWPKKFPPQFVLMPDVHNKDHIVRTLADHLPQTDKPKKGWYEKRADDLVKLVNLGQDKK